MKLEYIFVITLSGWILPAIRGQDTTVFSNVCGTFQIFPTQHALGAVEAVGIVSRTDCEQFCLTSPTCLGYEYDTNTATANCWIHNNPVNTADLYDDPLITLYILSARTPCSSSSVGASTSSASASVSLSTTTTAPFTGGACGSFTGYEGQHALGAQPVSGIVDRQNCLDNCISNQQCTAYEFDSGNSNFRCWFHFSPVNPITDLYNDNPNVNIYILERFPCTSTTAGSSISVSISGSVSSTTRTVTTVTGTATGQCFLMLMNTNALSATEFSEARTDAECRNVCLGRSSCTAYEADLIDPAVFHCWIHDSPIGELFNTNGVTINIRISCDTTTTGPATTTPAGVGQCVVFSAPFPDTQSIGAIGRGAISAQACMDLCRFDITCVAYELDIDLVDSCWTHHNPTNLDVVYETQFVTQYRVVSRECTTTGSSSTTGSMSTTVTVPARCANYQRYNNTQSINATPQDGVTTADACRDVCTFNALCVAYELDTNPAITYCWIHTDAQTLQTLYDAPTVTQFQVISRDCSTTGSTASTGTSTSATTVSTSTTRTSTSASTLSSSASATTSTGSTSSTSTSTTTPSGPTCRYTWTPIENMNVPGGTPNRASDLPSCQAACISNLYCIGIDVNSNNDQFFCYLITVDVTMSSFQGNTHYTLVRSQECPTGPPTNPPPTTTPTTPAPVDPTQGCSNFRIIVGSNADGGNLLGRMARQDCLVACVRDSTCYAVDYVVSDQLCFSHTSLSGAQLSTCCIRYECAASPCTEAYDRYTDRSPNLSSGEVQNSVTTAAACQTACGTKNCTRFSFINGARDISQSCYLYYESGTTTGREAVSTQSGIDLYVRKRCVSSPTIPPSTTVTPVPSLPPNYCPVDLAFIIDSSGSIRDNQPPGVDNWALIKTFVKDIISTYLNIGVQTDRVAIITFSDAGVLNFDFNRYTDASSIMTAIDNLPFIGYETNTPAALQIAQNLFSDTSYGTRNRSAKFACLVTDGVVSPQWKDQYQPAVDRLKQYVKARYAIGVTTQISVSELLQFTETQDTYTTVLTFADLAKVRTGLGTYINSVDCNGNFILTSPMSVSTSTTVGGGVGGSSTGSSSSTTTTALSTTTTTPTTTTPIPQGGEGCFGAITRTSTTGRADPLRFPTLLANRNNVYVTTTDSFVATAVSGFYFIEICAGAATSASTEVATRGAYPALSFAWLSTAHNGVVSNCRSGVLSMTRGVRVYLQQISTGAFSNNDVQTSWSMFSISDVIRTPFSVLSAIHRQPVQAPQTIPFVNPISNPPGQYDPSRYQYLCGSSGVFFFSFSAGVPGGQAASLRLIGLNSAYEITTASTTHNSVVTLDRVVVAQCFSSRVSVQVTSGQITPGGSAQSLISFQAFPYQLPVGDVAAAWGLYRSTSLSMNSVATDPLQFDIAEVTQGVTYSNNVVTLTLGGYYYVYMSAGCPASQRVFMTFRVNSQIIFSVLREATNDNGVLTLGHGMVLRLQAGDVLKVVSEPNSALFSSQDGLHTSFVGIRLYAS